MTSQCMQAQIIWVHDGTHLRFLGLWVALRVGQLCLGKISPCIEERHSPCPLPTYFQVKSYQVRRNYMPSTTFGKKIPNENKYFSIVREKKEGEPKPCPMCLKSRADNTMPALPSSFSEPTSSSLEWLLDIMQAGNEKGQKSRGTSNPN